MAQINVRTQPSTSIKLEVQSSTDRTKSRDQQRAKTSMGFLLNFLAIRTDDFTVK